MLSIKLDLFHTIVVVEETPECPGGKFVRRKSVAGGLTAPLTLSTVAAAA